jgi:hypothetical protein
MSFVTFSFGVTFLVKRVTFIDSNQKLRLNDEALPTLAHRFQTSMRHLFSAVNVAAESFLGKLVITRCNIFTDFDILE